MITKEQRLRLGIFLVVSILLLVAILIVFLYPRLKERGIIYAINFKGVSVNGLYTRADVKYQGVTVGKVIDISVNPNDLNSIIVSVRMRKGFPMKVDMKSELGYMGITGLKFIELSGGNIKSNDLKPGGRIQVSKGLGETAEDIVANIDSAVKRINQLLSKTNEEKISEFLENIAGSSGEITQLLKGSGKDFKTSVANLRRVSENLHNISSNLSLQTSDIKLGELVKSSQQLISMLNQRFSPQEFGKILKDIDGFVETSSLTFKKSEAFIIQMQQQLSSTVVNLQELLENLNKFSRDLAQDPSRLIRKEKARRKK